jgi:hypothetical protein
MKIYASSGRLFLNVFLTSNPRDYFSFWILGVYSADPLYKPVKVVWTSRGFIFLRTAFNFGGLNGNQSFIHESHSNIQASPFQRDEAHSDERPLYPNFESNGFRNGIYLMNTERIIKKLDRQPMVWIFRIFRQWSSVETAVLAPPLRAG